MKIKIICFIFSFLLTTYFIEAQEYYQATTQLNIRSGAGTSYGVVGSISQGEKVLIDTIISGWGQISVNGHDKGFASMKYLTKDFKDYSSNSTSSKNGSETWKTTITIIILLIIAFYQIFVKKKSSSNKSPKEKKIYSTPKKATMKKPNYYCENCGVKSDDPRSLLSSSCFESPNGPGKGKHVLYQGNEKSEYRCKFCGNKFTNLRTLCTTSCFKNPNISGKGYGHHKPAL